MCDDGVANRGNGKKKRLSEMLTSWKCDCSLKFVPFEGKSGLV